MSKDAHALRIMLEHASREIDYLADLLSGVKGLPQACRTWSAGKWLEFLRIRLRVTQAEVAARAGVAQSQVSRAEGDEDVLVSTWRRIYGALGFELLILPAAGGTVEEHVSRARAQREPGRDRRECRPRPRRRWGRAARKRQG